MHRSKKRISCNDSYSSHAKTMLLGRGAFAMLIEYDSRQNAPVCGIENAEHYNWQKVINNCTGIIIILHCVGIEVPVETLV